MEVNKMRYKYYRANNKIICVSTFAGKPVRGVAVCSPNDKFDFETGAELARLRCDAKIATKRFNRADKKLAEANLALGKAEAYAERMKRYFMDAHQKEIDAYLELGQAEANLNS